MREDSATESDLVRGGYRDRVLTELAQNAADAAARANVPGRLRIRWVDNVLHVANTGAPLDLEGVHALTALRVSAKSTGVGRFGVGFTAVRAISDDIEFRSRAGGVRFGRDATERALRDAGVTPPTSGVPVLRLAWPSNEPPAQGYSSEIVLRGVDPFPEAMQQEAVDLLLELEALESIDIDGVSFERTVTESGTGLQSVAIAGRQWWQYRAPAARWLVPLRDGVPTPVDADVLRAPTRSDEELSLPALVVADVPMQPDRRRILPGTTVSHLASGYGGFLAALPAHVRPRLVPVPGFARSEVDGALRDAILGEAARSAWLLGASGVDLVPSSATVLPGLTEELGVILADVFPGLVSPTLSGPRYAAALAAVGVHRIGLARLAEMLTGVTRAPSWWGALYDALEPLVTDGVAAEELAALAVPLADGRTVTGPRTTVLGTATEGVGGVGGVRWARLVHPDASSPLLARLGATSATASDLLSDPALEAELDDMDWDDEHSVDDTVRAVLALAANADAALPSWLGSLPLRDAGGELRAADELLIPGAPLADLLSDDSPFGVVAADTVERYGVDALRAVGVGWGFAVTTEELPTGPDHDLDDEDSWWRTLSEDPDEFSAVRDLDLVDEQAWPQALTHLLDDPRTRALVEDRSGYTAWWLRTHAVVDGRRLGSYRAPSDIVFDGLLDPLDHPRADELAAVLAADRCDSGWFTRMILSALADPSRSPTPAVIARAHRLVADAVASGTVDIDDLDLPPRIRAMSGALVDPGDAVVVDRPWFVGVVPASIAVLSSMETAPTLASVLDVRTASESIESEVIGIGRVSTWDREAEAVLACAALGLELPSGGVVVHRELVVQVSGAVTGRRHVGWWITEDGVVHSSETWERPRGR